MGATMQDRAERVRTYAITRLASAALVLLVTTTALASVPDVPAAADPAVPTQAELAAGTSGYHPSGNAHFTAPAALAHGAAATGGSDGRRPPSVPSHTPVMSGVSDASSSRQVGMSFGAAGDPATNTASATLGAGSGLFGSHVPTSPVDGSSLSGSSGLAGVLTLLPTGIVAAAGADRPPLPPYGRRTTWTFREPLTRPG